MLYSIFILHITNYGFFRNSFFGTDTGGAGGKYDEEVPQAYEQTSDAQGNSANAIGNQMDSGALLYTSPALDLAGVSLTIDAEYSPQATDSQQC